MPTYYTWNATHKKWIRRLRGEKYNGTDPLFISNNLHTKENVGRMYFVHPSEHERFALRTLLLYRKGCCSFAELRTVNGIDCLTNREAVIQLGLAEDDNEWIKTLEEATLVSTAQELRELFVMIIIHCSPSNPGELWTRFKNHLSEDILHRERIQSDNNNIQFNDIIYNKSLQLIQKILNKSGQRLEDFTGMPSASYSNDENLIAKSSIMLEELNYDKIQLKEILDSDLPKLKNEQIHIYNKIMNRVDLNQKGFFTLTNSIIFY